MEPEKGKVTMVSKTKTLKKVLFVNLEMETYLINKKEECKERVELLEYDEPYWKNLLLRKNISLLCRSLDWRGSDG